MSIPHLRKEYALAGLRRKDLNPDPFQQFKKWFLEAAELDPNEANAMTLATADKNGCPSARMVLLRDADERGFVFFTNYESRKGRELAENPNAALVFYWKQLERQICITGTVTRVSREESEEYFKNRPVGSRIAALASKQSQIVATREVLEKRFKELSLKYKSKQIPLPSYWGGFILSPRMIEFWQGRPNRFHDRFRYRKQSNGTWVIDRLSP